jgi:nucleoid-associated protein YgaU
MKKVLTSVCGGAALVALLAGCDPNLAQVRSGSQEELWYKQLKANYSSFEAPRNPAPAAYNPNWGTAAVKPQAPARPADDPDKVVDGAAEDKKAEPPVEENAENGKKAPEMKAEPVPADKDAAADKAPAADKDVKDAPQEKKDASQAVQDEENAGKFHVVKAGDTLGGIAKRYYGRASMEDVIFRANSKILKDRNRLRVGMRLVIPEL